MQVGENAEGNEIGKLRNPAYAKRKKQKGGIAKRCSRAAVGERYQKSGLIWRINWSRNMACH